MLRILHPQHPPIDHHDHSRKQTASDRPAVETRKDADANRHERKHKRHVPWDGEVLVDPNRPPDRWIRTRAIRFEACAELLGRAVIDCEWVGEAGIVVYFEADAFPLKCFGLFCCGIFSFGCETQTR